MKDKTLKKDKTLEIITHLIGIFTYLFGAFLIFLLTKDKRAKKHTRNALNWQISFIIYYLFLIILEAIFSFLKDNVAEIVIIFPFSLAKSILIILNIIFCIIAAFKAHEGILWDYPITINVIGKIDEREIEKGKRKIKKVYRKVKKNFKRR